MILNGIGFTSLDFDIHIESQNQKIKIKNIIHNMEVCKHFYMEKGYVFNIPNYSYQARHCIYCFL
jgi:hypothetical protein